MVPRFVSLKCPESFYIKDKVAVRIKNIPCWICISVLGFKTSKCRDAKAYTVLKISKNQIEAMGAEH